MAGRKKRKKTRTPLFDDLEPHTKQAIGAVAFVVLGIYLALSLFEYAGLVGDYTNLGLDWLFGGGAYLAPLVCFFYVYALMRPRDDDRVSISKIVGIALLFLTLLGFLELYKEDFGGMIGLSIKAPLGMLFGNLATGILLGSLFLIGLFLTFNFGLKMPNKETNEEEESDDMFAGMEDEDDEVEEEESDDSESSTPAPAPAVAKSKFGLGKAGNFMVSSFEGQYDPPPLSLLSKDKGKSKSGDVKANANIIKRTLKNFNIEVEMDEVSIGPSVTRYALKPAEGVRISRIVGLQNNLELALAASPIRIEAPIPGKSLVGIEVPNTEKATVGLANLLSSPDYTDSPKPLLVALGRDISGTPHFANIAKMPHGLIAGTTGSGKSVTIHAIITSLLFRNSPEQLRFIMIDPKRVELSLYNDIPHLLTPVITEPKKAILSLKWAIKEMERRYEVLQTEKVRDISSYHENIYKPAQAENKNKKGDDEDDEMPESMPYIVIFIDELADLMSTYPRELEANIVRLAQMSRAVGIHLILSTQRPSVNVITGLIKANVPSRIALQVASQIDSRTIIDQVGAEKLLGQGDMLYLSSDLSKPVRLQSAFISEEELKKVVKYLHDQEGATELDSIDLDGTTGNGSEALFSSVEADEDEDDLYEDARDTVVSAGKASTSFLQRKLRIGYSRAARLIDMLEERGVIGPQDGSKPREVLSGGEGMGNDDNEEED